MSECAKYFGQTQKISNRRQQKSEVEFEMPGRRSTGTNRVDIKILPPAAQAPPVQRVISPTLSYDKRTQKDDRLSAKCSDSKGSTIRRHRRAKRENNQRMTNNPRTRRVVVKKEKNATKAPRTKLLREAAPTQIATRTATSPSQATQMKKTTQQKLNKRTGLNTEKEAQLKQKNG